MSRCYGRMTLRHPASTFLSSPRHHSPREEPSAVVNKGTTVCAGCGDYNAAFDMPISPSVCPFVHYPTVDRHTEAVSF